MTTIDKYFARLHAAGWSVGESCFTTDAGIVWQVDGTNGEKRLLARAPTQGRGVAVGSRPSGEHWAALSMTAQKVAGLFERDRD